MTWSEVVLIVLGILLIIGWIAWQFASRLDRLHRKVVASRMALDAQLVRRAAAAADLASAGVLDPVTSVLLVEAAIDASAEGADGDRELAQAVPDLAAHLPGPFVRPTRSSVTRALDDGLGDERTLAESNLSATLREALSDEEDVRGLYEDDGATELLAALAGAWYRVQLARTFHNESVDQARQLRQGVMVRMLHLAGHATMPLTVDLDDSWPVLLRRPAGASSGQPT